MTAAPRSQTVIIADDHPDLAEVLAEALRLFGFNAMPTRDGASAWQLARVVEPQAMVLDLDMPGLTGIQVCDRVRAASFGEHCTVIAVTGWTELREHAYSAGFDSVLIKPADVDAVVVALRRGRVKLAGGRRQGRPAAAPDV